MTTETQTPPAKTVSVANGVSVVVDGITVEPKLVIVNLQDAAYQQLKSIHGDLIQEVEVHSEVLPPTYEVQIDSDMDDDEYTRDEPDESVPQASERSKEESEDRGPRQATSPMDALAAAFGSPVERQPQISPAMQARLNLARGLVDSFMHMRHHMLEAVTGEGPDDTLPGDEWKYRKSGENKHIFEFSPEEASLYKDACSLLSGFINGTIVDEKS